MTLPTGTYVQYTQHSTPVDATVTPEARQWPIRQVGYVASATATISANYLNGRDFLTFTDTSSIMATFNYTTGTLTLKPKSDPVLPLSYVQTALNAVGYTNGSDNPNYEPATNSYDGPVRPIVFQVTDAAGTLSNTSLGYSTAYIYVNATDSSTPALTVSNPTTAFNPSAPSAVAIVNTSSAVTIADSDSYTLPQLTIQISGNYQTGDVLSFTNTTYISGSWNATTKTLTLSGVASLLDYENALKSVTFNSTSSSTLTRTFSMVMTDDTIGSTQQGPAARA